MEFQLTVEECGETTLGHVVKDQELLPLGAQVVSSEGEEIGMPDLPQEVDFGLELPLVLGDLLPQALHRHLVPVLEGGLVHGPVGALPHDLRRRAEKVVGGENQGPVEVDQLPASVPAGLHLGPARRRRLLPPAGRPRGGALPAQVGPLPDQADEEDAAQNQEEEEDGSDDYQNDVLGAQPVAAAASRSFRGRRRRRRREARGRGQRAGGRTLVPTELKIPTERGGVESLGEEGGDLPGEVVVGDVEEGEVGESGEGRRNLPGEVVLRQIETRQAGDVADGRRNRPLEPVPLQGEEREVLEPVNGVRYEIPQEVSLEVELDQGGQVAERSWEPSSNGVFRDIQPPKHGKIPQILGDAAIDPIVADGDDLQALQPPERGRKAAGEEVVVQAQDLEPVGGRTRGGAAAPGVGNVAGEEVVVEGQEGERRRLGQADGDSAGEIVVAEVEPVELGGGGDGGGNGAPEEVVAQI